MLKLAFTPRWLAGLFAVLALVTGFVWLSSWQLSSSQQGHRAVDPAKDVVRPYSEVMEAHGVLNLTEVDTVLEARGSYVEGSSYLIENRLHDGETGYWVISLFIPEGSDTVATSLGEGRRGMVVARGWTAEPTIPAEPEGTVVVAGRLVGNDGPAPSNLISKENRGRERLLASAAASHLTNLWNAPLYTGILTADSESRTATPLTDQGAIAGDAPLLDTGVALRPIRAEQVTDDSLDMLNIFYAVEWLVFAGFALYLWWRLLKDAVEKEADPAQFFEYEGQYWVDEATGRPYYYDPADDAYYFFDEVAQESSAPRLSES